MSCSLFSHPRRPQLSAQLLRNTSPQIIARRISGGFIVARMAPQDVYAVASGVALAAAGTFAGCAVFVSAVEHPAGLETSVPAHFAFFPAMYGRAARLQGGLAVLGSHAAMVAAAKAGSRGEQLAWSAAGAALGAVWPWTLLAMMPTNKTILKQDVTDKAEQEALLTRWGRRHLVRTLLSCASFGVMVSLVVRRQQQR